MISIFSKVHLFKTQVKPEVRGLVPGGIKALTERLDAPEQRAHVISEDDVQRIMKFPFTMIGSDGEIPDFDVGTPHPRSYGTFVRVLGRYVRGLHTITLEDAVHRMSGLPAQRLKLTAGSSSMTAS